MIILIGLREGGVLQTCLWFTLVRGYVTYTTIPQYRLNKTKQHTLSRSVAVLPDAEDEIIISAIR